MDRLKIITILISVVALGIAAYAAEEADVGSRIQTAGPGIVISRNRLGGAGAVELRRGNRLDVFGGLDERILAPPDYFDLAPIDEAAADKLTAALVAPGTVQPFRPFSISWEVMGPEDALSRVNSYQLNVFSFGPIFGLSAESDLTPDGHKAQGSENTSMWQTGKVQLWARFGSGIRELEVTEITMDLSDCTEERLPLVILTSLLQGEAATRFVEAIQEEAGEDVIVSVLTDAVATFSSDGFTFHMDIKLASSEGTLIVRLGMQFMIAPRAGNLAAFSSPGYRLVDIDADGGILAEVVQFISLGTLGEPNLVSYQHHFSERLKNLADGFASAIGRQVRGLPPEVEDELEEAQAPKAIATSIDMSSEELIVTLCPITTGLVSGFEVQRYENVR